MRAARQRIFGTGEEKCSNCRQKSEQLQRGSLWLRDRLSRKIHKGIMGVVSSVKTPKISL
jgi:hypothetical protein